MQRTLVTTLISLFEEPALAARNLNWTALPHAVIGAKGREPPQYGDGKVWILEGVNKLMNDALYLDVVPPM